MAIPINWVVKIRSIRSKRGLSCFLKTNKFVVAFFVFLRACTDDRLHRIRRQRYRSQPMGNCVVVPLLVFVRLVGTSVVGLVLVLVPQKI